MAGFDDLKVMLMYFASCPCLLQVYHHHPYEMIWNHLHLLLLVAKPLRLMSSSREFTQSSRLYFMSQMSFCFMVAIYLCFHLQRLCGSHLVNFGLSCAGLPKHCWEQHHFLPNDLKPKILIRQGCYYFHFLIWLITHLQLNTQSATFQNQDLDLFFASKSLL